MTAQPLVALVGLAPHGDALDVVWIAPSLAEGELIDASRPKTAGPRLAKLATMLLIGDRPSELAHRIGQLIGSPAPAARSTADMIEELGHRHGLPIAHVARLTTALIDEFRPTGRGALDDAFAHVLTLGAIDILAAPSDERPLRQAKLLGLAAILRERLLATAH